MRCAAAWHWHLARRVVNLRDCFLRRPVLVDPNTNKGNTSFPSSRDSPSYRPSTALLKQIAVKGSGTNQNAGKRLWSKKSVRGAPKVRAKAASLVSLRSQSIARKEPGGVRDSASFELEAQICFAAIPEEARVLAPSGSGTPTLGAR